MAGEPTESAAPEAPQSLTTEEAGNLIAGLFDEQGNMKPEGATEEAPEDPKRTPPQRGEGGKFAKTETAAPETAAETQDEPKAPEAPSDWGDDQKAAFAALPPDTQALVLAADTARSNAVKAREAEIGEKLKTAEAWPERQKQLEASYQALHQISDAEAELRFTLKNEFSDMKSSEDRLALSNPASAKYDPARAARLDSLLNFARELQGSKEGAERNRQAALQEQGNKNLADQEQKLLKLVPEWGKLATTEDGKVKIKSELSQVREFLVSQGADTKQVAALSDALSLAVARKAYLYDKTQAEQAQLEKAARAKLAAAKPVQKPGVGRTDESGEREGLDQAQQRLKRSGSIEDAKRVFEHLV